MNEFTVSVMLQSGGVYMLANQLGCDVALHLVTV